jgi:anoctamin-1
MKFVLMHGMEHIVHSFDIHSEGFFTPAIRSRIVQFILDRQRFTEDQDDDFAFGVERLISELVYTAAYPLHDVSNHTVHNGSHLLASFMLYDCQRM